MALLYWTVGWEMGVVKRVLEAAGVNWGYFFDHNPFEPHCNSHPNNFLVLPPVSYLKCTVYLNIRPKELGSFTKNLCPQQDSVRYKTQCYLAIFLLKMKGFSWMFT